MGAQQRILELSEPKSVTGTTSSTAGEPTPVTITGIVFEVEVYNQSTDYNLYVSFDLGDTWITVPPDSLLQALLGGMADPVILLRSDGASQPFMIVYRLRA